MKKALTRAIAILLTLGMTAAGAAAAAETPVDPVIGKVLVDYAEWEFCHFIEGEAILTNEEGKSWTLKAGDGFIIPSGFKGTWETVKKVRKHYVILLPRP